MIDSPLPHLDRVFDYAVPEGAADVAVGSRVRVRFAGRLVDAFVVARGETSEHPGSLKALERVVGREPMLTPETIALVEGVAERWAGTFSDVVRAAVPPRHARAESVTVAAATWVAAPVADGRARWGAYDHGPALVDRLRDPAAAPTRAAWSLAPATAWADEVAELVDAALERAVGGVIVVVPDARDVDRLLGRLPRAREAGVVAVLTADQGPERRYREFLRVLRGGARVVVGTRGAVFAPVRNLALMIVWDDGDDALVDPQAPYWNARDVAALRSHQVGCSLVVGSPARSVVTEQWCQTGWAQSVQPSRSTVLARAPKVRALSADDAARDEAAAAARIPHQAWQAASTALATGPVLVQVARRGYVPHLACQTCREVARCSCGGPLAIAGTGRPPHCAWCGALAASWACAACGGRRIRAVAIGAERTAEEIGRAFPDVPILASHAGHMIDRVGPEPAVVVATPGAEPDCDPGYQAVLLLDARTQLQRPYLDAAEDAVRRWFAAARLAVPGGRVVVTAGNAAAAVQALVRWDAPWFADRELAERQAAQLPPATRLASLTGHPEDLADLVTEVKLPHRVLGPVPLGDEDDPARQRLLISVPREQAGELSRQLRRLVAARAALARTRPVHVRLDPRDL